MQPSILRSPVALALQLRDWLDTVIDPAAGRIKVGGDTRLADALIEGLHERLFGIQVV